jgi:hypothetical protein
MKRLILISKILIISVMSILSITIKETRLNNIGDLATLEFPPNQEVGISNPLLWKVKVSCVVKSIDESDILQAKIGRGSATLNGQDIKDGTEAEVKNGDILIITASRLGSFKITNLGQNTVETTCSLTTEAINEKDNFKKFEEAEELDLNHEIQGFLNFTE